MAEITAQLVSVDRMLWKGGASIVTAQTTEGEIGVLPGHEPFLGQLKDNGVVTITPTSGDKIVAAVQGGFVSVTGNKVTILADFAIFADEVDANEAFDEDDPTAKARHEAEQAALRRKGSA
ncbi:F0F1 ATP synthase subunit epsilon [Corynebacterium tuscaniense]|uniref:ATP synthase epsilon chain n=1 Tax=Corynebacterium tuscaniense TaxID=302449 RepID=A0A2N6T5Q4_9CORY|nr:F0F1 ATP synthase subunit epsilon [Corynebacterium tuscaniense]KAA8740364.1 F0F1 ATP synthase subunit epsilon [Corynebacterium tuscaniense]KGF23148.1 ATP synthase F0F1 subunit epsilon [Corynebacterium tuscaniense DNF00037]PMC64642.1 F0F1 ATP synthase subunit epsilon [Corynebacterium tuscaniense]